MDSIFSITAPGFMFFLLIVCIGYVALGDLSIKTRIGSLERLIRYILAWVWINLVFLFIFSKSEWLLNFINTFFLIPSDNNIVNILKVIMFALSYFLILVSFVWCLKQVLRQIKKYL